MSTDSKQGSQDVSEKVLDDWFAIFLNDLKKTHEDTVKSVTKASEDTVRKMNEAIAGMSGAKSKAPNSASPEKVPPTPSVQPQSGVMKKGPQLSPPQQGPAKHSEHAEKLKDEVKETVAKKILGPVGTGLNSAVGQRFVDGMEKMLATSPKISEHFQKLFGDKATLRFDTKVPSACFDAKENQIIMPGRKGPPMPGAKPPDPLDMVDAFLFESCNVERAQDYVDLQKRFMDNLDTETKSFGKYADDKTKIECEATTKQAQLLFDLYDAGGELAPAGKRNLLATGGNILARAVEPAKVGGRSISQADLDQFTKYNEDIQKLRAAKEKGAKDEDLKAATEQLERKSDKLLKKHQDLLRAGLPLIDTDPDLKQAVLDHFANTRHNVNKGKPTDKGNLKTKEMYAFEHMESLKEPELIKLFRTSLDKSLPVSAQADINNNWEAYSSWMDSALRTFELDEKEPHARQKVILDIVDKLEADFPESKGKLAAAFGFTPEMKEVADARFEDMKSKHPDKWNEVKDAHLPPIKGWAGKLPIPLTNVSSTIPPLEPEEGASPSRHRSLLQETVAKDRELLPLVIGASEGKANYQAVPNAEAGVNTSFKIQATDGKTPIALFKPLSPGGSSTGEKLAPCMKRHGAKEAREVACSAWNQFCGGLGDYPTTVPANFDGQKGSLMAWRGGAKELSDFGPSEVEEQFAGSSGEVLIKQFEANPTEITLVKPKKGEPFRVSLDGRTDEQGPTRSVHDLKKECDETLAAKKAKLNSLIENVDTEAAQDLMAFHVATLQMDAENACNVMFTMDGEKMRPFAIDGGLSAPDKIDRSDLKNPCWCKWPQAKQPWSEDQRKKFEAIDVRAAAEKLRGHMGSSPVGPLEEESLHRMMASTQVLKLAAKAGFNPVVTWNFIQDMEKLVLEAQAKAKGGKDFLTEFTLLAERSMANGNWTDAQKMGRAKKVSGDRAEEFKKQLKFSEEFPGKMQAMIDPLLSQAKEMVDEDQFVDLNFRFSEQLGQLLNTVSATAKEENAFLAKLKELANTKIQQIIAVLKGRGAKADAIEDFKVKVDQTSDSKSDKSDAEKLEGKKKLEALFKKSAQ